MPVQSQANEAALLDLLRREGSIPLETVVHLLPQMSWNQVFECVDMLSRRGEIILLRRGFDYEVLHRRSRWQNIPCSA